MQSEGQPGKQSSRHSDVVLVLRNTVRHMSFILQASNSSANSRLSDVRMRYQNRNLVLPICSEEGKHLPGSPEFCTLAAFRERVKELTPVDWDSECAPSGRT